MNLKVEEEKDEEEEEKMAKGPFDTNFVKVQRKEKEKVK